MTSLRKVEPLIHLEANRNNPERLALILPGTDTAVAPTHWSFGQLASLVGAPAAYPSRRRRSTHKPST